MKRVEKHYMSIFGLVLALVFVLSAEARAELYTFDSWLYAGGTPGGNVMNQLSVAVTDDDVGSNVVGENQVLFIFRNEGPTASSITDIYFDDGTLLRIAGIYDTLTTGVSFDDPATPGNLPNGNAVNPHFVTSDAFSADSDNPITAYGVNPGESVGILFDLQNSKTLANVIAAMYAGFALGPDDNPTGTLRIGVHVQSIATALDEQGNPGSQSYILTPVPGAVILGLLGLGAVGLKLRKFA